MGLALLEGRVLTHDRLVVVGFYVTKQPSPKELEEKITFEEARQRERDFFATEYPWRDKEHLQSRMGTTHLTKALSNLLGNVINDAYVTISS